MKLTKRRSLQIMGTAMLAWNLPALGAEDFPSRPIKVVVPFPPGGTTDVNGRAVAQGLAEKLKATVVVDNLAGAAGVTGSAQAKRAAADGYTLLLGNISTHSISPNLQPQIPYKPLADFDPIAHTGKLVNLLVVHPSLGIKSVKDLIAYAKANPGKLSYGSSGVGGTPHLSAELFKLRTGTDIVHIPYKGGGPMLSDLLGGHVHLAFGNLPELISHVDAGKLIALGVTSSTRWPRVPNIPTVQEQGVPDFDITSWMGLFAPKGLAAPVLEKITRAAVEMQKSPEYLAKLAEHGFVLEPMGGKAFVDFVAAQNKFWADFIRQSKIKPE